MITPSPFGLTLKCGVFIHSDFSDDPCLIIHELVYTSWHEKLGVFLPSLRKFLLQLINIDYPEAPLGHEVIRMAEKI